MRNKLLLTFFCLSLVGCVSFKKDINEPSEAQKRKELMAAKKFEKASKLLDQDKHENAEKIYKELLQNPPTTSFELITLYNLGIALEGQKKCEEAIGVYRQIVNSAKGKQKKLQAQSLFRLSYMYECVGKDGRVISSLHDVMRRTNYLLPEIGMAEAPARLAGAYARLGNRKMAEKYFVIAERGINTLGAVKKKKTKRDEILSRTLYLMGNIDPGRFSIEDSLSYLYNLEYTQRYLLRSIEVDHKKWSVRSAEKLMNSYDRIWTLLRLIEGAKRNSGDAIAARKKEELKFEVLKTALNNIQILKRERHPETRNNELLDAVLYRINEKEKRFNSYLAKSVPAPKETRENVPRFGKKRKGRLIDPQKSKRNKQ